MHKYLLKDISQIYSGSTPSTSDKANYGGNIIWITPKDLSVQKCKYINKGEKNITQKGYQSCSTTILPIGTVLLSSRAPIGLLAIASSELCTNQGFKNIVPNSDLIDSDYLYYFLSTKIREIEALGSGTTFKEVSKTSLENYQIFIHDIYDQKKISNFLNLLDKKIELNNKINFELEQIAKEWYNYWFVQFDFPGENGRPYKSSGGKMVYNEVLKREIPDGWEVKHLSDYFSLIKDGTHNPPKRVMEGIPLLTGTMFDEMFLNYKETTYISRNDYEKIHKYYQPQIDDIIITKIGTVGKINILTMCDLPIAIHCNSAILRTLNKTNTLFVLFLLKSQEFKKHLRKKMSKTIQEYINLEQLSNVDVIFPSLEIQNKYSICVAPIYEKLNIIREENTILTNIRDFLLPLLMNGQVSVQN